MYTKRFLLVSFSISIIISIAIIHQNEKYKVSEKYNYEDILFELYIPRINLKRYVYTIDSSKNNVDNNISILEKSNISSNLYFLASHSGGGKASYFDDLIFLEKGDIIWINNYAFIVEDMFYIIKNGYFNNDYTNNTLILITCSTDYNGSQLVIKSKLFYKKN